MSYVLAAFLFQLITCDLIGCEDHAGQNTSSGLTIPAILAQGYWDPDADRDLSEYGYTEYIPKYSTEISFALGFLLIAWFCLTDSGWRSLVSEGNIVGRIFGVLFLWVLLSGVLTFPVSIICMIFFK